MKDLKLSNVLFASAFTLALGAAAPLAVAGNHDKHDADGTHHEMDKKAPKHPMHLPMFPEAPIRKMLPSQTVT